ncbi:MAG: hypothetical protein CVV45_16780, partial [Spirochaetae bacterium HGW-Spirochaetae-10]
MFRASSTCGHGIEAAASEEETMQKAIDPLTALVLAHTAVAAPRLCPAIRLHLITPDQPLWRA